MTHYRVRLDERTVPESVRKVLDKLRDERGVIIKGGAARLVLLEMLVRQGKKINPERLEIEREIKDLDIILIHPDTLPKSKEFLLQREQEIRNTLGDAIKSSLVLMGQDIEPVRGRIDKEGKISEETTKKILNGRDLTINEVVLSSEDGVWWMYYTTRCWRDIISGVGMLNAKDAKTTRRDLGRIVPSNRGFYRLFRFWVEGKVEKVWLPKYQRIVHLLEMARRQALKELPLGANLGRYSLVIANKYKDSDLQTKRRWMTVFRKLGFTDLGSWEIFVQEQQLLDALKNSDFEFESELPFEQIIDRMIAERAQRQEARHQRKATRNECQHQFETIACEGCSVRCLIQKCQKCTRYILSVQELPCNKIFIAGNWKIDERSLMEFPGRF